jgi:acetylornithine deacetylase/succinyl-diaminopimelate desuccinylase-like protein
MRGIFYVELSVKTAVKDAHSGLGGSLFANAAWRLVWALSTLKGADERILIPGFYDDVRAASARDRALLAQLPDEFAAIKAAYQIDGFLKGVTDPDALKHMSVFEPTCTICGLTSGYQGPGSKTVQPAEARAKVDFRLVPDQDPHDIAAKLRAHLNDAGFADVAVKVLGAEHPAKVDPDDPFVQLTAETARSVYGRSAIVEPIIGGSGPLYPFVQELGVPVVSAGIGYPDGQAHAPNEHVVMRNLRDGIRHTARIVAGFGAG